MKAVKDNKEYDITENQKAEYLSQGYDILDENRKVIEYSPKKTIAYSEYQKVKEELEKAKNNDSNAELTKQVEELTKTNSELTKANSELTKQVKDLTKQVEKAN